LCRSFLTGLINLNEIEYLKTNLAVIQPAMTEALRLWGRDDKSNLEIYERQDEHKRATQAGDQMVLDLRHIASAESSNYIDRTTVAFAATYLMHYSDILGFSNDIKDKHIPKLLIKIAVKHSLKEEGPDGLLTLKPYDSTGSFLDDLVRKEIIDETKKNKKRKITTSGGSLVSITWSDLPTLAAMSKIVTARMGQICESYADLKRHGLHDSPFEAEGTALGYYCANGPMYNRHYAEAVCAVFTNIPARPTSGAPPHIPNEAYIYGDPLLNIALIRAIEVIRETCHADYGSADRDDDTATGYQHRTCLRYHSAIFMHLTNEIAKACSHFVKDSSSSITKKQKQALASIEYWTKMIKEMGAKGWLDVTVENSGYTAAQLRNRHIMLTNAISAPNKVSERMTRDLDQAFWFAELVHDKRKARVEQEDGQIEQGDDDL
jgi:hypothetical protein